MLRPAATASGDETADLVGRAERCHLYAEGESCRSESVADGDGGRTWRERREESDGRIAVRHRDGRTQDSKPTVDVEANGGEADEPIRSRPVRAGPPTATLWDVADSRAVRQAVSWTERDRTVRQTARLRRDCPRMRQRTGGGHRTGGVPGESTSDPSVPIAQRVLEMHTPEGSVRGQRDAVATSNREPAECEGESRTLESTKSAQNDLLRQSPCRSRTIGALQQ